MSDQPADVIFDERFQDGCLPQGWYTDTPVPKYSRGAWDCRAGDGVMAPLAHDAWESIRVEVEISDIGASGSVFCGADSRSSFSVALGESGRTQAGDGGYIIAQSFVRVPARDGGATIVFEWTRESMRASSASVELIACANFRQNARMGTLQLGFRGCVVRGIKCMGVPLAQVPPRPRAIRKDFPLEVTVDFNDDLMPAAWTHKTFDALFKEFHAWGATRVSWIDLGREADGYFDFAPYDIGKNGLQTFRNVGDIFTKAVKTAHAHGMELIGILKPFDMAIMGFTYPPYSEMARKCGRIHRIGGALGWSTKMAADNQHLNMARKPSACGPAKNDRWTRIDLVKEDDASAAISINDLSLIISDDNEHYRAYDGPITRTEIVEEYPVYQSTPSGAKATAQSRRSRVFRLSGLDLRAPFVAIVVRGAKRSFMNRLCDLVHLFGEKGEETHFTYGLSPRRASHAETFAVSPESDGAPKFKSVGPQGGFEFNRYPGSPTGAMTSGGDAVNTPLPLDRGEPSYIALARGKDRGTTGILSPSFAETRALWMTWVNAMLDAGADGIDIRPGHHNADFAWIEYGFEQPVRDEMLARTGVDIWQTDDFDHEMWRNIRGEGYTQFIREAAQVIRARGKKVTLHIDGFYDRAPGRGGAMNMAFDWKVWFHEGLIDHVTGKSLWPDSALAREVLALAHEKGITVTYVPYCNNFFEDRSTMNHVGASPVGCEKPVERLIQWGRAAGFDGFGFYEGASALWAAADETVGFRPNASPVGEVFRREFKRE